MTHSVSLRFKRATFQKIRLFEKLRFEIFPHVKLAFQKGRASASLGLGKVALQTDRAYERSRMSLMIRPMSERHKATGS